MSGETQEAGVDENYSDLPDEPIHKILKHLDSLEAKRWVSLWTASNLFVTSSRTEIRTLLFTLFWAEES